MGLWVKGKRQRAKGKNQQQVPVLPLRRRDAEKIEEQKLRKAEDRNKKLYTFGILCPISRRDCIASYFDSSEI